MKTKKSSTKKKELSEAPSQEIEENLETVKITQFSDGELIKKEARSLEDILNPSVGKNPFKTSDEEDFSKQLGDMTLPDMQSLAVELGVFPSGNKTTLKNKLKKEFNKKFHTGKGAIISQTQPILSPEGMTLEQKKLFNIG